MPTYGLHPKKQVPGRTIDAGTMNNAISGLALTQRIQVGEGLRLSTLGGVPFISAISAVVLSYGLSGANGIPAMSGLNPGSGTINLESFNGTTLALGESVTAYNMSSNPVGANKQIIVGLIDGYWSVLVESC